MKLRNTFSTNLRKMRKKRKLTQQEFAEMCDISTNYVGDIERQKNFPSVELIEKMAEVLEIEPHVLFLSEIPEMETKLEKLKLIADLKKAVEKVVEKY